MTVRFIRLGLVCCGLAGAAAPSAANELTIATFNAFWLTRPQVHRHFPEIENDPRWNDPAFRDQKFAEATESVAQVLSEIDADVVALTEVGIQEDVEELRDTVDALGVRYDHIRVCKCNDPTIQKVAVLDSIDLTRTRHGGTLAR